MSIVTAGLSRFQHLSDETISRLIAGELSTFSAFRAQKHLVHCWQCRRRREAFEHAAMQVTAYGDLLVERIPPNPQRRALLVAELSRRAKRSNVQPMLTRSLLDHQISSGMQMNPFVATIAIVVTAALLLIWVWQRPTFPVSAAQLIGRAEIADQAIARGKAGVVFQRIRIVTAHSSIERDLYRDAHGIRRVQPQTAQADAVPVEEMLAKAGVDWDAPLSPSSFRSWRDRQAGAIDSVAKKDGNLMTVVTRIPNSLIQEETFTVRSSDFHPVERTIQSDSFGTIEIAELNFAVLDWSGVNEALFEPRAAPRLPANIKAAAPILPAVKPSAVLLDSAELQARLTLNHLHADEGEQIDIRRTDDAIEVKGVVETEPRKQEILDGLRLIPHVKAEVQSIEDLDERQPVRDEIETVEVQSVDVQTSALERYLSTQGHQRLSSEAISRRLLDGALKASQNANELAILKARFPAADDSQTRNEALLELSQSYSERLLSGLDAELSALEILGFSPPQPGGNATQVDLASEVERNQALCRELLSGNYGASRSVEQIVPELYLSIARIHSAMLPQKQ